MNPFSSDYIEAKLAAAVGELLRRASDAGVGPEGMLPSALLAQLSHISKRPPKEPFYSESSELDGNRQACARLRLKAMKPTPPSANARSGRTPGSGTPLGLVWLGRLVSALKTGRPGQRLCTTAHALLPHMEADAGTLHATEVRAATLARPAIKVILFIAVSSPMTFP